MNIDLLKQLYRGFYIEIPNGNNSFSFKERNNKKIYVPPLIFGTINDLAVGDEIVFSEVNEGSEHNKLGLKQFVYTTIDNKEIFIFDNHNHVFFFWLFALKNGIIKKGSNLVHVDQHTDMREPDKYFQNFVDKNKDLQEAFEYTNYVLNVGNFIKPAQNLGLFSEINIIDSSTSFEQTFAEEIVLDIDIDIFSDDMSYIPYNIKIEKIRNYIKQAKFITVATSPYFMDQHKSIEIVKEIFQP